MSQERMPLEVFFRGERNYIQGSLILFLATQELAAHSGEASGEIFLREAKFNALMDHAIDISTSGIPDEGGTGLLKFSVAQEEAFVSIHPAERSAPPRHADRPGLIADVVETDRLCGRARYQELQNFDEAISAVVELNKELHSRLGERILDIWFAGLRNARLAVARSPFGSSGHIAVGLMLERPSQERILTLSRVQVMPDSGKPLTFEILFSYRMGTC
jgi:hypothetical protein